MQHIQLILPSLLLLTGFLLKLLIGRQFDWPVTIQSVCELPVDIIFLALSFIVAFTIAKVDNQLLGLLYFFIGIPITIVIVSLWRVSVNKFLKGSKLWILMLFINLLITGFAIIKSVTLIVEDGKVEMINNVSESIKNNDNE